MSDVPYRVERYVGSVGHSDTLSIIGPDGAVSSTHAASGADPYCYNFWCAALNKAHARALVPASPALSYEGGYRCPTCHYVDADPIPTVLLQAGKCRSCSGPR